MEADEPELPARDEAALPPLRIHHFFLWTIAVAAVFSGYQLVHIPEAVFVLGQQASNALSVLYYVPQAIAFATVLLGFYWRYRGLPFLSEPGHWLLLAISIEATHEAYAQIVLSLGTHLSSTVGTFFLMILPAWCASLALAVIYFMQWRQKLFSRFWKRFFLVVFWIEMIQMALNLLSVLFQSYFISLGPDSTFAFFGGMQVLMPLLSITFGCFAMWGDISKATRRHWSHWCGAVAWTAMSVMQLLAWSYYVWWMMNGGLNKAVGS